jgi:hypothetical protein
LPLALRDASLHKHRGHIHKGYLNVVSKDIQNGDLRYRDTHESIISTRNIFETAEVSFPSASRGHKEVGGGFMSQPFAAYACTSTAVAICRSHSGATSSFRASRGGSARLICLANVYCMRVLRARASSDKRVAAARLCGF